MVHIKVPATTANLGPGFDVLGLALELFDEYIFEEIESGFVYDLVGASATEFGITADVNNLVYRAFQTVYTEVGQPVPGVRVQCFSRIPICRGLGSSAAAVVAGLVGANALLDNPLGIEEILRLATALEGHPDNVAPALLGGLVTSLKDDDGLVLHQEYQLLDRSLFSVLVIPDFTLKTSEARAVLPEHVLFSDAIYNISRVTLLISALIHGKYPLLSKLMEDRLHQPYRQRLIPGFEQVREAGLKSGAYSVAISGAGPTILAFTSPQAAKTVGEAMVKSFELAGIQAKWLAVCVHNQSLI